MGRRWSQRSAWLAWIVASLFGWVAIIAAVLVPASDNAVSVAQDPPASENIDMAPASGPADSNPAQKSR
jgi:hypothetical protein